MAGNPVPDAAPNERVIIFIDGSNFYHSVKDSTCFHDYEIDFEKVLNILRNNRLLIGVYYYNAPLDRGYNEKIYWKQQKFFSELKKIPGFNVILCNMRKILRPGSKKPEFAVKGDDVHLATDMVSFAYENAYDTAILVSGDGDFVPTIKKVQKLGKGVENAYFSISRSNYLKNVCDSSVCLDDFIEECVKMRN
jgi:uncharacterized LabA/DUF88 family protein